MTSPTLVWSAIVPTAPAISGISIGEVATGVLSVSWDLDQVGQGWVEWGYSSGAYTGETEHETSLAYDHHSQSIPGLTAGATVYLLIHAVGATGLASTSSEQSYALEGSGAVTYTQYVMPTGSGWTDGTNSIAAAQAWLATVPDGADSLHVSDVILTPGYTWTWAKALSYAGRRNLRFNGQGTQLHTVASSGLITACGNSGGGKVRRTHVAPSGDATQWAAFTCGQGGTAARATNVSFVGLQVEGGMSATIDLTTGMAGGGNEFAAGIWMGGQDGGEVSYCNFYRTTGDGIALYGSAGAVTGGTGTTADPYVDPGDFRTTGISIHHNWIRSTGRVGIFPGKCANVTIASNLFQDSAYAFVDFEPDYWHMRIGGTAGVTISGNSFTGGCNWATGTFMAAIFMSRVTSRAAGPSGWHFDGPISITNNVFASAHKRTDSGTQASGTSGKPDVFGTYGPIYKDGLVTITGNRRVAYPYSGPAVQLANCTAGGSVSDNVGFGSSPIFVTLSGSGTFSVSGNT